MVTFPKSKSILFYQKLTLHLKGPYIRGPYKPKWYCTFALVGNQWQPMATNRSLVLMPDACHVIGHRQSRRPMRTNFFGIIISAIMPAPLWQISKYEEKEASWLSKVSPILTAPFSMSKTPFPELKRPAAFQKMEMKWREIDEVLSERRGQQTFE